jgi:hypothetical protein
MNAINTPRVFMRSMATRQANLALSKYISDAVCIVKNGGFDLLFSKAQASAKAIPKLWIMLIYHFM